MEINRENIESILLDLSEGKLNPAQIKEVELFVMLNPEFSDLFDAAHDLPVIGADAEYFENKSSLKRHSFESLDIAFARELEGDLDRSEKTELQELITHFPELSIERERFALTVLEPEQIKFPHKEHLKKRTGIVLTLYPHVLRIAALFLLALLTGIFVYFFQRPGNKNDQRFAKNGSAVPASVKQETNPTATSTSVVSDKQLAHQSKSSTHTPTHLKTSSTNENSLPEQEHNTASNNLTDDKIEEIKPLTASVSVKVESPASVAKVNDTNNMNVAAVQPKAHTVDTAHYMDVYEVASRLVSKMSKGKVDLSRKRTDDGSQELAINAGDFQFSRKKSQ
jgi:hypothetical protein